MVSGDAYMGMFRRRAMLYGENFWEILIIPLRFFSRDGIIPTNILMVF